VKDDLLSVDGKTPLAGRVAVRDKLNALYLVPGPLGTLVSISMKRLFMTSDC
jgi:hypothetical protein